MQSVEHWGRTSTVPRFNALLDDWREGRSYDKKHFDDASAARAAVGRAGRALGIAIAGALHFAPLEAIILRATGYLTSTAARGHCTCRPCGRH